MAIKYSIDQHTVAFPSKCLASLGGKHIYNITLSEDVDNGWFVGKGEFVELDRYKEAAPTSVTGTVVAKAANGNYYVEVVSADADSLFVYQVPMIEEEYNNTFKKESNFFNASGTEVRAYELAVGDVVEISAAGFDAEPTVGASVSLKAITGKTYAQRLG